MFRLNFHGAAVKVGRPAALIPRLRGETGVTYLYVIDRDRRSSDSRCSLRMTMFSLA